MLLVMVGLQGAWPSLAQAQTMALLEQRSRHCLQGRHLASCTRALQDAELLQQRAADRQAYPCQTLLLGLQADLIMERDRHGRGAQAVEELPLIIRGCSGL